MQHDDTKRAKRIAAIVYLALLAIIVGGTYISNQIKAQSNELNSAQP